MLKVPFDPLIERCVPRHHVFAVPVFVDLFHRAFPLEPANHSEICYYGESEEGHSDYCYYCSILVSNTGKTGQIHTEDSGYNDKRERDSADHGQLLHDLVKTQRNHAHVRVAEISEEFPEGLENLE